MSDSLRNSIDVMLAQGASADDILAMLAPRSMSDAAAYLKTKEQGK